MKNVLFIILSFLFIIFSCSGLKEGIIYKKEHTKPYCITTVLPFSTGKSVVLIPQTNCYSESFYLYLKKYEKEEELTGIIGVTKDEFERFKIDDYYKK